VWSAILPGALAVAIYARAGNQEPVAMAPHGGALLANVIVCVHLPELENSLARCRNLPEIDDTTAQSSRFQRNAG
jgi:hypothetical protein